MASYHGPALPPGFKTRRNSGNNGKDAGGKGTGGSSLPPGIQREEATGVYSDSGNSRHSRVSPSQNTYGPALPPGFTQESDDDEGDVITISTQSENLHGPALPPRYQKRDETETRDEHVSKRSLQNTYGPALPPGHTESDDRQHRDDGMSNVSSHNTFGPALPPGYGKREGGENRSNPNSTSASQNSYGPALPPDYRKSGDTGKTHEQFSNKSAQNTYGPALPPGYEESKDSKISKLSSQSTFGPALPPGYEKPDNSEGRVDKPPQTASQNTFGPALPPGYEKREKDKQSSNHGISSDLNSSYGPVLPPGYRKQPDDDKDEDVEMSLQNAYGPALPPGYQKRQELEEDEERAYPIITPSPSCASYGPALPPGYRKSEDTGGRHMHHGNHPSDADDEGEEEDIIGPMPSSQPISESSVVREIEERARAMKNKLTGKDEPKAPKRESWMTELPEYSKAFGLGPRSFRKNAGPSMEDRSGWTDTPADKARKAMERREKGQQDQHKKRPEARMMSERDKQIAEQISSFNKDKRSESLVDMHTKERKRKMKEEGYKPNERRPFDREVDLQVNRFDDAKKKRMMKQAAGLDSKFQHSNSGAYI
ncbi:GPALPP motifs-containing protein 1-like [Ptychodera flava]|uniref:GPALPP motifs-containing protein 1-like n=1 Tax=Ptychodera flava TaxID=63121 RepID=UPI00396A2463